MARKDYVQGIYAQGLCAWGVRAASEWGVPMVANPQGMEDFKVRDPLKRLAYAPFRAWVREGCRAADRVIATDHATRHEVPTLLGVDPDRVVVIPNGVDIDEIRQHVDAQVQSALIERWPHLSPVKHQLKGISVARLEANKGIEYLLGALATAKMVLGDDWNWLIVGDGSQRARLEALASEAGLHKHVEFVGQVDDAQLHNLSALSNLFAHPTLYEGSSLVTLEAMAHCLPVVASATGGIPDKVIDGETGFQVKPGDSEALGSKIVWMATRPERAREMGARGANLARQRFGWSEIAAQTEALFLELLDEKATCRGPEVSAGAC
jgi:glycosyltransferase involved in cell wall biosynthesis